MVAEQGKTPKVPGASLLNPATTRDDDLTEVKCRSGSITALYPRTEGRDLVSNLSEHGGSIDAIEGVREIQEKDPAIW